MSATRGEEELSREDKRSAADVVFELTSIVPLTLYALIHVGSYARALFDSQQFGAPDPERGVQRTLELLLVWLPLLLHSVLGLLRWRSAARASEPTDRSLQLLLRVTAPLVLLSLLGHVVWLRLPLWRGERAVEDVTQLLAAELSSTTNGVPLVAALHLLGLGVTCVHLGAGSLRFLKRHGWFSERIATRSAVALALTLFALGSSTVVSFATGSAVWRFAF